ncbi:MAG TPA: SdpI family protein [Chitinophagaceae bacterium]|nr:SdpI family protein [Chitinophagaceae bacterium]
MNTFRLKREIWLWLVILIPEILYLVIRSRIPGKVPSHFDFHGRANGYMAPVPFLALMTGTSLGIYLLLLLLPRIDPKRANYPLFSKTFQVIRMMILLMLSGITSISLLMATGLRFDSNRIIFLLILLLIVVMGNYISNVRPNWFVGIRTPWTLSSEQVWRKTHQIAGKLMVIAGTTGFILCLWIPQVALIWVFLAMVCGSTVGPAIYSYFLYQQEQSQPEKNTPA